MFGGAQTMVVLMLCSTHRHARHVAHVVWPGVVDDDDVDYQ